MGAANAGGDCVEPELPRGRIVGEIPIAAVPVFAHRAVLGGETHSSVGDTFRPLAEVLLKPRHTVGNGPFPHAFGEQELIWKLGKRRGRI